MAEYKRFFVDKIEDIVTISNEEFVHAVSVLRVREQEKIILLDNTGYEYLSEIIKIDKKSLTAKVIGKELNESEPKQNLILICGFLKGDKTELIVQKAVELGVKEIVVFSSKFSSAYINENKLERLNRVSMEAAKQCGRGVYPKVIYKDTLNYALEYGKMCENKFFACEFASKGERIEKLSGSTAVVVGSEGGFSKEEFELSLSLGYKTLYLGKRILRAETAGIVLTGILMHALGELD